MATTNQESDQRHNRGCEIVPYPAPSESPNEVKEDPSNLQPLQPFSNNHQTTPTNPFQNLERRFNPRSQPQYGNLQSSLKPNPLV